MHFTCPHCGVPQVVTDKAASHFKDSAYIGRFSEMGELDDASCLMLTGVAIRCANLECSRATVSVSLGIGKTGTHGARFIEGSNFTNARLYPLPSGKPFPVGVPQPMLEDYNEAWAIIDLSPKSSATLARRCLQAMIRDFCKIQKRSLYHEIEALEEKLAADELPKGVEPETIAAMKVLKDKGNIGAHMTEVDGLIMNVEPGEAQQLLGLIEMLFNDWYVARHKRQKNLKMIEALAKPAKEADGD